MRIGFHARQLRTGRRNELLLLLVEDGQAEVAAFLRDKKEAEKALGRQESLAVELVFEPEAAAVPPALQPPQGAVGTHAATAEAVQRVFGGALVPAGIRKLQDLAKEAEAEERAQTRQEQPQGDLFPEERNQTRQGNLYLPPY